DGDDQVARIDVVGVRIFKDGFQVAGVKLRVAARDVDGVRTGAMEHRLDDPFAEIHEPVQVDAKVDPALLQHGNEHLGGRVAAAPAHAAQRAVHIGRTRVDRGQDVGDAQGKVAVTVESDRHADREPHGPYVGADVLG